MRGALGRLRYCRLDGVRAQMLKAGAQESMWGRGTQHRSWAAPPEGSAGGARGVAREEGAGQDGRARHETGSNSGPRARTRGIVEIKDPDKEELFTAGRTLRLLRAQLEHPRGLLVPTQGEHWWAGAWSCPPVSFRGLWAGSFQLTNVLS